MAAVVSLMTEREQRLRAELRLIASTDPLTGLMNRRSFDPRLEMMLAEATTTASSISVVLFDLDHFKAFNDQHGHLVGDMALYWFAEVLRGESRNGDAVRGSGRGIRRGAARPQHRVGGRICVAGRLRPRPAT